MTTLKNDSFLRALMRQPTDYTPVWMMRQAGRYLPEYRETRKNAGSFMQLCTSPDFATEVTLQPLDRYPLIDAAILFSDILTVPDAMGLGLYFAEGEGPKFKRTLCEEADIQNLAVPDMAKLQYVFDAVSQIRRALDGRVPLIGFSGSPWTLACYMVEGGGSDNWSRIKAMMFNEPAMLHRLLEVITDAVIAYLKAQHEAGAQALQVFDTWGGVLSPAHYREFSLRYLQKIAAELPRGEGANHAPLILFGKGNAPFLEELAATGAEAVGIDWHVTLAEARRRTGGKVALQGNLDPAVLFASPDRIREEVGAALESYGHGPGHVFNLGHGVTPDVDPEHVKALIDAVHALSWPYHESQIAPG
jgi:uroporphyrinogen decarboxylase